MCTVSYIPFSESNYILTQNRDVGPSRAIAIPPAVHLYRGISLQYPIDPQGGGTWNAMSDSHQAFILNGADYDYFPDFNAPKSRGSLCLDILVHGEKFMEEEDLSQYDDFTLIYHTIDKSRDMLEFRWDGSSLIRKERDVKEPQFWISRGLYTHEDYRRKRQVFNEFIDEKGSFSPLEMAKKLWKFHQLREVKEKEGFLIDRAGMVRTVSVFQTIFLDQEVKIRYENH